MASPLRNSQSASSGRKKFASLLHAAVHGKPTKKPERRRVGHVERLEERRVLNGDYYPDYGLVDLPIQGLKTSDFVDLAAMRDYANRIADPYGPGYNDPYYGSGNGYGARTSEGLSQPVLSPEAEPNDSPFAPQMLRLSSASPTTTTAIVTGSLNNTINRADVDYFGVNLRGGDVLDLRIQGLNASVFGMELTNANGVRIVTAFQPAGTGLYSSNPADNPLSIDGSVSFAYVIPTDGLYLIQVGGGVGGYELRAQVFRSPLEQQPIGSVQEIYLDFDGVLLDRSPWGITGGIAQIPSLFDTLQPYGYTAADVNSVIDVILARAKQRLDMIFPPTQPSFNGQYDVDGIPGNAGYRLTNSRDHGERWGLPNVTRGIVGGSSVEFFGGPLFGVLGIAESIDIGNLKLNDQFIVLPENYLILGLDTAFNLAPSASTVQLLGNMLSATVVHEFGHIAGLFHTDPNQPGTPNLMDVGAFGRIQYELGIDQIFGTADDRTISFTQRNYLPSGIPNIPGEFLLGSENQAASMAHALASGTRGATVRGTVFNDANQNGSRQQGEFGIAGQTVYGDLNGNGRLDSGEPRAITIGDGSYTLSTPAGSFFIRSVAAAGFQVIGNGVQVNVALDQTINNVNLGQVLTTQTVTGYKWADLDGDGIRDENEPGIGGVYIYVDLDGDNRPDLAEAGAFTAADGSYFLDVPANGTFAIREVIVPGFIQTFPTNAEGEHVITPATPRPLVGIHFGNRPARDYGDLPEGLVYKTLAANNGPSHGFLPGLSLGSSIDIDADGIPSVAANGDDLNGSDDEDGVTLPAPLVVGRADNILQITVTNTTGSTAYLQGWMDFNGDGDFDDEHEHIIPNRVAASGNYQIFIPANATVGNVYARFRLSRTSGLGFNGPVNDGEVEDYRFQTLASLQYTAPDSFTVARNSTLADNQLDVLLNDPINNVDGFTPVIIGVAQGIRGGQVTTDGQFVRYQPLPGFVGTDLFQYEVRVSPSLVRTESVSIRVDFVFDNPIAIDDSFDVIVNSLPLSLDVIANDVRGKGGALVIPNQTITTSAGGTAVVSPNGQQIIYTPAQSFEGTETFTYRITDSTNINGPEQTATVTIHVLPGDFDNDEVEFSLIFRNEAGQEIDKVVQGQTFLVDVMVLDRRTNQPAPTGVFSAYLDLLYNSRIVLPGPSNGPLGFDVQFGSLFNDPLLQTGSDDLPGLIDELGSSQIVPTSATGPVRLATVRFVTRASGTAKFFPDPADDTPMSDVYFSNDASQPVPTIRIRYLPRTIEVLAEASNFPQAVDDIVAANPGSVGNIINVLRNDIPGATGPIRIDAVVNQPSSGSVTIDRRGTADPSDDILLFNAGLTSGFETFSYRIIDAAGNESYGNVTVQVGSQTPEVRLQLELTDEAGNPITQIRVNQTFQLRGYVQDLRSPASLEPGVFAAYQDILLNRPDLASFLPSSGPRGFDVAFQGSFLQAQSGDVRVPGIINELGAQQFTIDDENDPQPNPEGPARRLQFIIPLRAMKAGTLTFVGDPADNIPSSDTLFFDRVAPVAKPFIDYTDVSITILSASGTAESEGQTNQNNPLDANNDGYVSALDMLIVVNEIMKQVRLRNSRLNGEGEGNSASNRFYPDVNQDGVVTALDLLSIVNHLSAKRKEASRAGEGEAPITQSTDKALSTSLETSLDSAIDVLAADIESIKKAGTRI